MSKGKKWAIKTIHPEKWTDRQKVHAAIARDGKNYNPDMPDWARGFDTGKGMTVEEIACELGISHQRVSQILAKALIKVARAARRVGLKREDVI